VGTPENVHPPDSQPLLIGLRLRPAPGVYGEDVEYSSPEFLQATSEPNGMRVWFTHAEGLTSRDQEVGGFEVAGDDHNFVPATAKIEKVGESETVLVSRSPKVQFSAVCAL